MAKQIEITRKKYEKIRKMDHNQMQQEMQRIYDAGMAAGKNAVEHSFNAPMAMASISMIKGIGKEKLSQIHLAMLAAGAMIEPVKLTEAYEKQQAAAKVMKAYGEYTKLIMENPGMPTVAWVDSDIVAEDGCNRWSGSIGQAYIQEYIFAELGREHPELVTRDDTEKLEEKFICDDGMTEEEAERAVGQQDWKKAIFLNVDMPEI